MGQPANFIEAILGTFKSGDMNFGDLNDFDIDLDSEWVGDIRDMHDKFGVNAVVRSFDKEKLALFLKFRLDFLQEELCSLSYLYHVPLVFIIL